MGWREHDLGYSLDGSSEGVPQSRSLLGRREPEEEERGWRLIELLAWSSWVLGFPGGRRSSRVGFSEQGPVLPTPGSGPGQPSILLADRWL
jgi:hypothetical protein